MNRVMAYAVSACFVLGLVGCGGGSSGRETTEPELEIPEDFDSPDSDGVVEEVEEEGTEPGESFQGRRFFVEGDAEAPETLNPGLWVAGETQVLDEAALTDRQLVTIPGIVDNNGDEELAPHGVFYRTESDFRFALASGEPEDDEKVTIAADADAKNSCLGPLAFDAQTPEQSAVAFALLRDEDGNCVPPDDPETQQWSWLAMGTEDGDPNEFEEGWLPRVGLPASGSNPPSWLIRDLNEDGELKRVFTDTNGTETITMAQDGETVRLTGISPIAELSPDSFLVAKQKSDSPIRLAHFNASDNTLRTLTSERVDAIPDIPESNWVTVRDETAYVALENLLLRADADGVSIIDGIPATIDGTDVLADPLFVKTSDTHTLWGVRAQTEDGTVRQVRMVEHGSGEGGTLLALAGYADAQVRGHADGWMYFTVANSAGANGRLDTPRAVGINPAKETIFVLENAHWIGSTLMREATGSFSDPATAPINGLFFRAGDDLTRIGALIDPAAPLADDADEQQPGLSVATIGNLDSAFSAVSMGAGFGPDRLLTAIRVDDADVEDGETVDPGTDTVISSAAFLADPREGQLSLDKQSGDGSLVRALSLF